MAFDKVEYDNGWRRANRDRIAFEVPKGKKAILQDIAKKQGKPMSEIIVEALEAYYKIDLTN